MKTASRKSTAIFGRSSKRW